MYDVLYHTHHIFSESLLSGDDNDRDKYLQIDKCKDKDKCKVLPRPNVCYFFFFKSRGEIFKGGIFFRSEYFCVRIFPGENVFG